MNAVIYCRISPRPKKGDSLDVQREELTAYAVSRGWAVSSIHEDDRRSGSELLRPGMQEALRSLRKGNVLLVRDLSRFAREVTVALALESEIRRIGAYIATYETGIVLDPTAGELEYHDAILPRFVKYWADHRERIVKNKRTSDKMREHQQNGRNMSGKAPVGLSIAEDGVTLIPNQLDLRAALRASELRKTGASLREIARVLRAEGFEGRKWDHRTVKKLLELRDSHQ